MVWGAPKLTGKNRGDQLPAGGPTPLNAPEIRIRLACPDDLVAVTMLLDSCHLPTEDLTAEILATFFVAESAGQRIGVAGFEGKGGDGLLRSLAVAPEARGHGVGERLVSSCENMARAAGVNALYLLTTTADAYLRRLSYADMPRESVPLAIAAHPQFRGLCPASAKCLGKCLA